MDALKMYRDKHKNQGKEKKKMTADEKAKIYWSHELLKDKRAALRIQMIS